MSNEEKKSTPIKTVQFLSALVALLTVVAGTAYQFGIKEATVEQKLEESKRRELELQEELGAIRRMRSGYESQMMEQRTSPVPTWHKGAK